MPKHMQTRGGRSGKSTLLTLFILILVLLGACSASRTTGFTPYAPHTPQRAVTVQSGTIRHVGETVIDETDAGPEPGWAAAVIDAAGALLADTGVPRKQYRLLAITVDMDNGATVTIAQEEDDAYLPGDRVRLVYGDDNRARLQLY